MARSVLKTIRSPENRPDEGETLSLFEGALAVCQVKAFEHDKHTTEFEYSGAPRTPPSASYLYAHGAAKTVARLPTGSFRSGSNNILPTSAGAGTLNEPVVHESAPAVPIERPLRVKSDILMPRGSSLFDAQNSLHLLMAIHDALLGIMAFAEAGQIHCDISAYILLLINLDTHHGNKGRPNASKLEPETAKWGYNGTATKCATADSCSSIQANTSGYKSPRLQLAEDLGRGTVCVIHDAEFMVNEDTGEKAARRNRMATPAFMSAHLLESYMSPQSKVTRTYIHDAESLLWVLIWVVAHRSRREDRWEVNDKAARMIQKLSTNDFTFLWESKEAMLSGTQWLVSDIWEMGTELSKDLASVIGQLAGFFYLYLYAAPPNPESSISDSDSDLVDLVEPCPLRVIKLALHKQYIEESRSQTFDRLFATINRCIARLEKKRVLKDL
ncbi:hypothetical protein FRC08_018393 [Ceratobasidium sp. 394]|nr:hypothetical protein FRC08_018393 [Ceratobasidium sp. 394]